MGSACKQPLIGTLCMTGWRCENNRHVHACMNCTAFTTMSCCVKDRLGAHMVVDKCVESKLDAGIAAGALRLGTMYSLHVDQDLILHLM